MTEEVLKGYSPDELERWKKRDCRLYNRIGLTAFGSMLVFMITACYFSSNERLFDDLLFLCALADMGLLGYCMMYNDRYFRFQKAVVKALAGLELGVVHCSDDLVILMGFDRIYADRIINGEYDDLMRDERFCKLMPTKDSM